METQGTPSINAMSLQLGDSGKIKSAHVPVPEEERISFLQALARAVGGSLDDKAGEMTQSLAEIDSGDAAPGATMEFSARAHEFGIYANSGSNSIKTVGDAMKRAAQS